MGRRTGRRSPERDTQKGEMEGNKEDRLNAGEEDQEDGDIDMGGI